MGLRFRKSIKIAPGVKLNLNKKSSSITFGGKGIHHTISSTGKKTTTVGVPGTGISYSKTSGGGHKTASPKDTIPNNSHVNNMSPSNNNGKKWHEKTGWIIFFLIFFFPVGLFLMWKSNWKKTPKIIISILFAFGIISYAFSPKLEQVTLSANTEQIYDINSQIPIDVSTTPNDYKLEGSSFDVSGGEIIEDDGEFSFSASKPGKYTVAVNIAGVESNKLTLSFEDKAAIAKAEAEEKAKQEAAKKAEEERIAAEQKAEEERIKAEQEAAAKAEAERIAAEQEAARLQAEQEAASQAEAERVRAEQEAQAQQQADVGGTVYWTPNGEVYHSTSSCPSLSRSKTVLYGSIAESGKSRPCKNCY